MRIAIVFIFLAFCSCSSSPVPGGIIPPEKMVKVVKDIVQVDEFINNFLLKDTLLNLKKKRTELYEKVFLLHATNRKEFYTSFKYYQAHPDIQKNLFDTLYSQLSNVKPDTVKQEKPQLIRAR